MLGVCVCVKSEAEEKNHPPVVTTTMGNMSETTTRGGRGGCHWFSPWAVYTLLTARVARLAGA